MKDTASQCLMDPMTHRVCYHVLKNKGIIPSISPRSNAGYWEKGYPRNEAVKALKDDKLTEWKSFAINSYSALKLLIRNDNAQVSEALAKVKAMNKVIRLDMPIRQQIN